MKKFLSVVFLGTLFIGCNQNLLGIGDIAKLGKSTKKPESNEFFEFRPCGKTDSKAPCFELEVKKDIKILHIEAIGDEKCNFTLGNPYPKTLRASSQPDRYLLNPTGKCKYDDISVTIKTDQGDF